MSYWAEHGVIGGTFFILFLLLLPRLTILFSVSVASIASYIMFTGMGLPSLVGSPLVIVFTIAGWICWLLLPRLFIAIAALTFYASTNLVLVVVSCLIAYGSFGVLLAFIRSLVKSLPRMKAEWAKIKHAWAEGDAQPTMGERTAAWWEVLGVGRDASIEEIKRAYRKIAMRTHPDTAPDGKADEATLRKATEAYNQAKNK